MKRWVITGPTGWIGQALLALLASEGDADALRPGEGLALFGSRAATLRLPSGQSVPVRPLSELSPDDVAGAWVVHLAYLTKDKVVDLGEPAFRDGNNSIDATVLRAMEQAPPAALFVASSGAARLVEQGLDQHPYGLMKLEQEARFLDFGAAHGVPVLCGRIWNVAGPHINKLDAYAVSNFAVQAIEGGKIRIEAQQPVFRSYLHITDLCRLVVRAMRKGYGRSQPVDLCGNTILEMADIAALVAAEVGGDVRISRADVSFAKRSDYLGCSQETQVLAMELDHVLADTASQVQDTISWIKAMAVPLGTQGELTRAAGGE